MTMNFPNSPSLYDTFSAGTNTWMYDGEKWVLVPQTLNLDDLGDVSASAPLVGQTLVWDGSAWVPGEGSGGGLLSGDVDGGILSPEINEAEVTNYVLVGFDGGTL